MLSLLRERLRLDRFLPGEKPSDRPVVLSHRRIFILPTQRGLGFALLLLILLLVSVNYDNNLGFILTFLLGSVTVVSILHSFRTLSGLVLRAGVSAPVFAGETAAFEVRLENPAAFPRIGIGVSAGDTRPLRIALAPNSATPLRFNVKTAARGWRRLGTITVHTLFPLGLFRAWSPVNLNQRVLVYPNPARDFLSLPQNHALAASGGQALNGSDDFSGLQPYQPGDSLRRIHWQALAKGLGTHSKQYSDARSDSLWLDWDQTPGEDTETRLSRLCRWVIDAENSGSPYGLRLPGAVLAPGAGSSHCARCLETLALFGT